MIAGGAHLSQSQVGLFNTIIQFAESLAFPDDIPAIDVEPRYYSHNRTCQLYDLLRFDDAIELRNAISMNLH